MLIYTKPRSHENIVETEVEGSQPSVPIDLDHLSKQTLGDVGLQTEVLSLFQGQSRLLAQRLKDAKTLSERKLAAHTLLGSARGIGAWRISNSVSQLDLHSGSLGQIEALLETVEATCTFIDEWLDGAKSQNKSTRDA